MPYSFIVTFVTCINMMSFYIMVSQVPRKSVLMTPKMVDMFLFVLMSTHNVSDKTEINENVV